MSSELVGAKLSEITGSDNDLLLSLENEVSQYASQRSHDAREGNVEVDQGCEICTLVRWEAFVSANTVATFKPSLARFVQASQSIVKQISMLSKN